MMREYAARMIYIYTPTGYVWVPRHLLEEAGVIEPEPELIQQEMEYVQSDEEG